MTAPHWMAPLAVVALLAAPSAQALAAAPQAPTPAPKSAPGLYQFSVTRLDGRSVALSAYRGQVMLIVNTASKCGLTPQYAGLEKLHDSSRAKGLAILGFPANDFLWQEPGTNAEIGEFCQENYGVSFDMFEKVAVKGPQQAPLYRFLTSRETNPRFAGEVRWNFDKFLIDRQGRVVARFAPKVTPEDPAVVKAIESELAKR
ncbi:MAG: glutathione peroxidase [Candidatus Sericytochromatia bacterium]